MNNVDRAIAVTLINLGYRQNRIASLFDVNQGRIAELSTGQTPVQKPREKKPFTGTRVVGGTDGS